MKTLCLTLTIACFQLSGICQSIRVTNIKGRAPVTGDVSPNQAREEALNDAKLNALKAAGIEEKISCYQSLNTNQVNDNNDQSFQSHIQSDILGAVKFDTVIAEGMITDSDNHVYYQVSIDAEVTTYTPPIVTTTQTDNTTTTCQPTVRPQHIKTDYKYDNGDCYSGQFANGKRDGYGSYHWANGSQYIGYYKNGVRNGPGVYYGSNGKTMTGIWTNGVFTKYEYFATTRGTTSGGFTRNYDANGQSNNNTVAPLSPQDKLSNDQSNFAQDVETEQQKIQ